MRLVVFMFLFLWATLQASVVWSQETTYVDSLNRQLKEATRSNKEKADIYFLLSDFYSYRDTAKAFAMLDSANSLIDPKDKLYYGILTFYEAGVYFDLNIEKSQQLYMQAENILKDFSSPLSYEYRARLWNNYGVLEQAKDRHDLFLDILLNKSIPYIQKTNKVSLHASYLTNVSLVLFNQKNYPKAIHYSQKAIGLLRENAIEDKQLVWAYLNLAHSFLYLSKSNKAAEALQSVEKIIDKKSRMQEDYLPYISYYYIIKTKYYDLIGDKPNSIKTSREGMAFCGKYNLKSDYNSLAHYLGHNLLQTGGYAEAKRISLMLLADEINSRSLKNKANSLKLLSEAELKLGNYRSAYDALKQLHKINDSMVVRNEKLRVEELEARYNTSEQEKKILALQNKTKTQNILTLSSVSFAILLLAFYLYVSKQNKKQARQELISMAQQKEVEISKALMEGSEQERSRVAMELHDGLGGKLTGIKINIENILETTHNNAPLRKVVSQLEETVSDIRNLSSNLMPVSLVLYGLDSALRDFVQNLQTRDTKIDFYASNLSQLTDRNKQLAVYRIVQELVTNAVKHAGALAIFLQCTVENNLLLIEIEDNGKGFDPTTIRRNMGLSNIETRVKYLNGKMNIDAFPQKGTSISIECLI
ncbi:Oxygen sensor histidine kinase nreB [Sphingobacterium daejeonense]|nr:Oxygen sensor histidine kinase nreB [Sphingobacterium daejeonense]